MATPVDGKGRDGVSRAHAEHLRTTHLVLIALCFSLLVVWATRERSDYDKAVDQLRALRSTSSAINKDPFWLDVGAKEAAETGFAASAAEVPPTHLWRPPKDKDPIIKLESPTGHSRCFGLQIRAPYAVRSTSSLRPRILDPSPERMIESPAHLPRLVPLFEPKTIADFEWLWEAAREPLMVQYPIGLADRYTLVPEVGEAQSGHWAESVPGCPGGVDEDAACHPRLAPRTSSNGAATTSVEYVLSGPCEHPGSGSVVGRLEIPVVTGSVPFDALSRLRRFFALAPPAVPYQRAFPEISALSHGFGSQTFDVAERILKGERDRQSTSAQILGVGIPASGASLWGIGVLFALQWYFLVHLVEFAERVRADESAWDVAWVGLYPTREAYFLFVASALLAPPIVTALLWAKGPRWFSALTGLASIFLSVRSWRFWARARRSRPQQPEAEAQRAGAHGAGKGGSMWVTCEDGRLVNLDHMQDIEDQRHDTTTPAGTRRLVARYRDGREIVLATGDNAANAYGTITSGLADGKAHVNLRK